MAGKPQVPGGEQALAAGLPDGHNVQFCLRCHLPASASDAVGPAESTNLWLMKKSDTWANAPIYQPDLMLAMGTYLPRTASRAAKRQTAV